MRKETKIGIFAIVTIALAIWGYKYLKGFNILSPKTTVYALYDRVDGLRQSTPIYINGLEVGLVANIRQAQKDLQSIRVTMEIDDEVKIPKDAVAEIVTTSLMGGTAINLVYDSPCSEDCVANGDYIKGVARGMLASLATPDELKSYVDELNKGLKGVLDTLSERLSQSRELNESVTDVRAILTNLRSTTGKLDHIMTGSASAIEGSLTNIESITGNLKESNEQIKNILANAEALTNDLKGANMDELAGEAKKTMQKLQATLTTSEKAIGDLESILTNVKDGNGAIGMMLNDPAFANEMQLTVKHLELLLQDIRLHPERYRRILSKKYKPYVQENKDPGLN
jgi:phospholipid/cholesterol/gamma-HCH transport system substrate-binding protein